MPDSIPPPPPPIPPTIPPPLILESPKPPKLKPGGCQLGCGLLMLFFFGTAILGAFAPARAGEAPMPVFEKIAAMGLATCLAFIGFELAFAKTRVGRALTEHIRDHSKRRAEMEVKRVQQATQEAQQRAAIEEYNRNEQIRVNSLAAEAKLAKRLREVNSYDDISTEDLDEDAADIDTAAADTEEDGDEEYAPWRSKPMTAAQWDLIRKKGGTVRAGMTRGEASELLDKLLGEKTSRDSATVRQMMVLRFWDKLQHKPKGKDGISAWMDEWYANNPDRLRAWELFKEECGNPESPLEVEIGIGKEYLKRVKSGKNLSDEQQEDIF